VCGKLIPKEWIKGEINLNFRKIWKINEKKQLKDDLFILFEKREGRGI